MDTKIIEPIYVVGQFQFQLSQALEISAENKLCFEDFKCGFGNGIIIWATLETKGPADMKDVQNFINDLIVEFTAPVCVKHLDAIQVGMHCGEGIKDKLCVFMCSGAVAYDFPVKKINKKAYVVPFVINPYIGQITHNSCIFKVFIELAIQQIRYFGFVDTSFANLEFADTVCRKEISLFHNSADLSTGENNALAFK